MRRQASSAVHKGLDAVLGSRVASTCSAQHERDWRTRACVRHTSDLESMSAVERDRAWVRSLQVCGQPSAVHGSKTRRHEAAAETLALPHGVYAEPGQIPMRVAGVCGI